MNVLTAFWRVAKVWIDGLIAVIEHDEQILFALKALISPWGNISFAA